MNIELARRRARAGAASEDGFTIIEVLVTAIVVVLVLTATFGGLSAAGRAGAEQRRHAESYAVAQKDQARLRALRISQLNGLDETRIVTVGGTDYEVHSTGQFVNDMTGTASCEEGTNSSDYISITSEVSWPSIGSRPPTVIKSIVAPPAGSLSEDTGALAVVIRDAAGTGTPNVPVSGSGAGSFSGSTGPTGCILFTDLPAGNYTLTPSAAAGLVDADGNPPGQITVSVVGQSTNTVVLRYDTPGSIDVRFRTRINGSVQDTTTDSLVVFNTGMTQERAFGTVGTQSSTISATPLFPFTSPYAVYAGSCAANNPNPDELPDPPAGEALADISVVPNQTASATIQLPALDLTVMSGSSSGSPGSPVNGATVKIADTECDDAGGDPIERTYTTNSSGKLPNPGLPYGVYDICAYRPSTNRKNNAYDVAVQTTDTDTVRTIYVGSGASGSSSGSCP